MIKLIIIFLFSIFILIYSNTSTDIFRKTFGLLPFSDKTFVLISNTSVYTCSSSSLSNFSNYVISNYVNKNNTSNSIWNSSYDSGIMIKFGSSPNSINNNICPFSNISFVNYCPIQSIGNNNNCKIKRFENNKLNQSNFDKEGNLIFDTKFKKQYSFEIKRSNNSNSSSLDNIIVIIDLSKHTQSYLPDLNSPRLKILRENVSGMPDMASAKNQEIIWTGNIKNYFNKTVGKYNNETYITLQFSTGRHMDEKNDISATNAINGERGFGILFDVSNSSNPNLLEYRGDGGIYTKYKYDLIKQLAGKDFVFYSLNKNGSPYSINDLLNKNDVKLKVKTFLTKNNKRVIETFIDDGSGKEVPYWTLKDLSKLKDDEHISDKEGFINATMQGSGYVIVRTDNIRTIPTSFQSYVINP